MDNPIEGLWTRSSQAEWFVPCHSCGEWNIPALEYHLDGMIGPYNDFISEKQPGLVCHKCRKPIDPRPPHGRWVHRYPGRKQKFSGYHIPQIILPLHCCRPDKWAELLAKREITTPATFFNEVLGESADVGQKLVTETELKAACVLPYKNDPVQGPPDELVQHLKRYRMTVLAVDWGGGGEDRISFTTLALLGISPGGDIHVLWGRRLLTPNDHLREARQVIHYMKRFQPGLLVHDYTGAGIARETILVQEGYPLERIMPIQYVRAASRNLIKYVEPTPLHDRGHYRLDKTRSLLYTFLAIKLKQVQFFQWDRVDQDRPGLVGDFLALIEEKTESRLAGDIYTITRTPALSDDFAQAVNIGCAALWHANGAWPSFGDRVRHAQLSPEQVQAAGNFEYGWEQDPSLGGV